MPIVIALIAGATLNDSGVPMSTTRALVRALAGVTVRS